MPASLELSGVSLHIPFWQYSPSRVDTSTHSGWFRINKLLFANPGCAECLQQCHTYITVKVVYLIVFMMFMPKFMLNFPSRPSPTISINILQASLCGPLVDGLLALLDHLLRISSSCLDHLHFLLYQHLATFSRQSVMQEEMQEVYINRFNRCILTVCMNIIYIYKIYNTYIYIYLYLMIKDV